MEFIYLTKEQAERVRGRHGIYSELQPIMASDGMFVLPKEVLNDKEHIETFPDLLKCKVVDIDILNIIDEKEPDPLFATKQVLSVKTISKKTIAEVTPITWKILDGYVIEKSPEGLFTKGLGLFNYSKPVTNFRGQKVSRWSLFKDLLKEIWRRIKKLFKCSTK